MGKLVVTEFISLDGVIEDPGGADDGGHGRIRREDERDAQAGSATLVRSLLARDLVDELQLMVSPIALGSGRRLFADGVEPTTLRFVEAKPPGAVVLLTLCRER